MSTHRAYLEERGADEARVLAKQLRAASAVFAHAGSPHSDVASLLLEAASAIDDLSTEVRVQRGLAVASQALAEQLSGKVDYLQQQLEPLERAARAPYAQPLHAPSPPPHSSPLQLQSFQQQGSPGASAAAYGSVGGGAGGESGTRLFDDRWAMPYGVPLTPREHAGGGSERGGGGGGETGAADDGSAGAMLEAHVSSLKQRFRQSGVPLPLWKQPGEGPNVYRLGKSRLELGIADERLVVRQHGGHSVDLLEYLSKSAL